MLRLSWSKNEISRRLNKRLLLLKGQMRQKILKSVESKNKTGYLSLKRSKVQEKVLHVLYSICVGFS